MPPPPPPPVILLPKLILILSPAKTLDLSDRHVTRDDPIAWTEPLETCQAKTRQVAETMKEHAADDADFNKFCKLLHISAKLGQTARDYWNQFVLLTSDTDSSLSSSPSSSLFPAKPCVFAFSGAAYQGLQIATLASLSSASSSSSSSLQYLQDHLRIVDPLYGWLRPLDVIQPYRLEMATKKLFATSSGSMTTMTKKTTKKTTTNGRKSTTKTERQADYDKDSTKKTATTVSSHPSSTISLQDFWRPTLQECLKREMADEEDTGLITTTRRPRLVLLNLASEEYSAAVLPISSELLPQVHVIKIVFQEPGGRIIGMHAKRARGLMVRYLAEHGIENIARVKDFREEGYILKQTTTIDDEQLPTTLVFERGANWKTTTIAKTAFGSAAASTAAAKKASKTAKPAKPKNPSTTKAAKKASTKATPETEPPPPRKRQRRGPK
jgi:uncharacterized protein